MNCATFKLRAREFKCDGETPEQSYAKAFTGLSPRDTIGAELFAKLVETEKAAPANDARTGHGTVTSNSRSFDADWDETGTMANRDNNYLQVMADAPKKMRLKIAEHAARTGLSLKELKRQIMGG